MPSDDDVYRETLALAKALIARRSLTPDDAGCLDVVAERLARAGFHNEWIDRGGVRNLWARHGAVAPLVCLAGHVDVVPSGPVEQWSSDPFLPVERAGALYGRGAADMKTSVAAMVTAAERVVTQPAGRRGSLALLLTADEEGDAQHGTLAVVDALLARGESIAACIVGEPTSADRFGDTLKNGRRGSLNGTATIRGVQCHIAYPERGRNPVHQVLPALGELVDTVWDRGNEYFEPTRFQVSNIHAGTGASNVVPGTLTVMFNIRFSTEQTAEGIQARVADVLTRHGIDYALEWHLSGQPFLTAQGPLVAALTAAVQQVAGVSPVLSTSGGTSDGRFLTRISSEVVEFGPLNDSIHKIDEHVALGDIGPLSRIYERAVLTLLAGSD
jgi:succinyl-diaminopimelate desuccinylase